MMLGRQTNTRATLKSSSKIAKSCRMSVEKIAVLVFCLLLVIFLGTIGVVASARMRNSQNQICQTEGCREAAQVILNNIDKSVNPCDDFYNFACGNFIKTTQIPQDKSSIISFSLINDKVSKQIKAVLEEPEKKNEIRPFKMLKQHYRLCMVENKNDSFTTLLDILGKLGNWPVLEESDWNEVDFDWKNTMYKLREFGIPYDMLINFYVGADTNNTFRRVLDFDQAQLGLEREYLIQGMDNKVVVAYYNLMVDLAVLCGADRKFASMDLKDVVEFEIKLAKITLTREERRNATALYNPMKVADMNDRFPSIPWMEYLNKMVAVSNITIELNQDVDVGVPNYYSKLEQLLDRTSNRVLANYIMSQVVMNMVPYLSDDFLDAELKYEQVASGNEEREPIWKECLQLSISKFKQASAALYVRKYFDHKTKSNAEKLVGSLKITFKKMLKELDWMDATTKQRALEKAEAMGAHVAYPHELLDDSKLIQFYSELELPSNENFLEINLAIKKFLKDKAFIKLPEPINKTDWVDHSSSTDVNAYYDVEENSIQLPAGILQDVFYGNERPQYINYGAMGFGIGHEITHGFDDVGRQFDKNGILSEWWEKDTKYAFMKKTKCIIDQYTNYTVPELELHLDGVNTQGENIADNGGVKQAYNAYNQWIEENGEEKLLPDLHYTQKQIFWISTATLWCSKDRTEYLKQQVLTDAHSPSKFRIIGSLSNSYDFAKDFNCPVGSKMNPKLKCQVW